MAARPTQSIAAQLKAAQTAIDNTMADAEIQGLVGDYGYPPAEMQRGKALADAASAGVNARSRAEDDQQTATKLAGNTEATARAAYQALAQVVRALFPNDRAKLTGLGLIGGEPTSAAKFIAAANKLFENALANADLNAALAAHGYKEAKLRSEQAKIASFAAADEAQTSAIAATQQATRDQAAALKAMNAWVSAYLKIAKVALKGKPELHQKLGPLVRSAKTPAQRGAPKKAAETRKKKEQGQGTTG